MKLGSDRTGLEPESARGRHPNCALTVVHCPSRSCKHQKSFASLPSQNPNDPHTPHKQAATAGSPVSPIRSWRESSTSYPRTDFYLGLPPSSSNCVQTVDTCVHLSREAVAFFRSFWFCRVGEHERDPQSFWVSPTWLFFASAQVLPWGTPREEKQQAKANEFSPLDKEDWISLGPVLPVRFLGLVWWERWATNPSRDWFI